GAHKRYHLRRRPFVLDKMVRGRDVLTPSRTSSVAVSEVLIRSEVEVANRLRPARARNRIWAFVPSLVCRPGDEAADGFAPRRGGRQKISRCRASDWVIAGQIGPPLVAPRRRCGWRSRPRPRIWKVRSAAPRQMASGEDRERGPWPTGHCLCL